MLMGPASEALIRVFGDDEARVRSSKKKAVAAEVLLDRDGVVLAEKAISVSSFPWALPLALQLRLGELGRLARLLVLRRSLRIYGIEVPVRSMLSMLMSRVGGNPRPNNGPQYRSGHLKT
jgi:hypothetical protein